MTPKLFILLLCALLLTTFSNAFSIDRTLSSRRAYRTSSATFKQLHSPGSISLGKSPTRLAAVEGDFDPEALSKSVEAVKAGSVKARLRALYKFTRPHTIRGTVLASIAGTIRALVDTPGFSLADAQWSVRLPRAIIGMIALLLGNAFIVGINQIFDEGIDKLNKPFLPVASGEMSTRFAWVAVLSSGIIGPLIV